MYLIRIFPNAAPPGPRSIVRVNAWVKGCYSLAVTYSAIPPVIAHGAALVPPLAWIGCLFAGYAVRCCPWIIHAVQVCPWAGSCLGSSTPSPHGLKTRIKGYFRQVSRIAPAQQFLKECNAL